MFNLKKFVMHSGEHSFWKIECDSLTFYDWRTLASITASLVGPFGKVEGVPRGGLKLAEFLKPYAVESGITLIVDDVLTTGRSMEEQRAGRKDCVGVVVFARGPVPEWIKPLFVVNPEVAALKW